MEKTEETRKPNKCTPKASNFKGKNTSQNPHHLHQTPFHHCNRNGYFDFTQNNYQIYPGLLPLPGILAPPLLQNPNFILNNNFQKFSFKHNGGNPPLAPYSGAELPKSAVPAAHESQNQIIAPPRNKVGKELNDLPKMPLEVAKRPDNGGVAGTVIPLLANHFLVKFDPSNKIFQYNVDIKPNPSKEVARIIKQKLVTDNKIELSNALPAYDGRGNFYSSIEFQSDKIELFVTLPTSNNSFSQNDIASKLFKVNIKLVSKFDGRDLNKYLGNNSVPLPQEYLHALDVVLRENSIEKCVPVGRSLYSSSMGGAREIGGGAIGIKGFFQSLRPTKQGLALNVDFSVTAFHESIGVIPYLQKRFDFLHDINQKKNRSLSREEKREVEKALKNIRVFVSHRETVQKYLVHCLTKNDTENLWFPDRDGTSLQLVDYFKDHYNYDIQFRNLPCLQTSRSKPCYLPMELCMICEGQRFHGKLSDDQTARLLKMGCQKPRERKATIDAVMAGPFGPTSGNHEREFKLQISREMTRLNGRILQPPKLKLGNGGFVKNVFPSRHDRQWNFLDSHVYQGTKIDRWGLISFGNGVDQKSTVSKFVNQLSQRCNQLGISLNKNTVFAPQFEPIQVLNNVPLLESKLKKIYGISSNNLQLLICVMEKKHKGYADFKRITETSIGVISQCCLYSNLVKPSSQFLANLALKMNAKIGGCTVALYNSLQSQVPRIFSPNEPIIFMGADVSHPHPLDDFSPSIAAVVGSLNWPAANKYVSKMKSQTHRQEIIQDLTSMAGEIFDDFYLENAKLPERIIFFRDGVSETQFYKVLEKELQAIKAAFLKYPGYNPPITFAVVQKRHHTKLFPNEDDPNFRKNFSNENVPPGTVVDTVITHPREFDFYLCSHFGVKGTSRPTHYHVLCDENGFNSDEFQKLVYNLCFTFVRCTKPVSLVPPAYYAHLAAYRGRLYIDRSGSDSSCFMRNSSNISRVGPPKVIPLPKVRENVKKFMFYC